MDLNDFFSLFWMGGGGGGVKFTPKVFSEIVKNLGSPKVCPFFLMNKI